MLKLLVIADDLTGALDAAAPLIHCGVEVCTTPLSILSLECLDEQVQVLSVNAATRHLPAEEARKRIAQLVGEAVQAGVPLIVKKTDSILRGNIGAELEGALMAHSATTLHFMPSLPAMNRVTCGGVHYITDIPVAETALGSDPFEPVTTSRVADIIAQQSMQAVSEVAISKALSHSPGIAVYDAITNEELDRRVAELKNTRPLLLAGCMGLVSALARVFFAAKPEQALPEHGSALPQHMDMSGSIVAFCGSVNAVSVKQCAVAHAAGAPLHSLTAAQILQSSWHHTSELTQLAQHVSQELSTNALVVIDASTRVNQDDVEQAGLVGISDLRDYTAANLGAIAGELLRQGSIENILVMGGDVLLALLEYLHISRLRMLFEFAPGVVVSELELEGRTVRIVSKSGGFGEPDLFFRISQQLYTSAA
ncbi:four-carbon acid sugar kinase family protein [Collinsella sp. zg1085]|uniref:four-carbon acid sugar kinase family protein n=1 Tax=Collinsella sp. zg1085 TaxID=2844380 RepID=UPI001C0D31CA|nr:four-carbon acid sugar kinase family protein [Collinsella sp. zg1085]QWT17478.1 four-carbon acid sugar kinase family protein [Collinsella sp. zg1085]